jgi:predicted AlkP superfamily pyrophosphatase or phosphodiesterase
VGKFTGLTEEGLMKLARIFTSILMVTLWVLPGFGDVLPTRFFSEKPRLVLFISIDQFRSDYLTRYQSRFIAPKVKSTDLGGFNFLMTNGAYLPFAQHGLLQDMTGPGHAVMSTGAYPYQSGVPLNYWFDAAANESVYCAEDPKMATVGVERTKSHVGTSPKNMLATTVGDELKNAGYPSRVVSVSLKDRSAIFMGGHRADLALWFDQDNYKWVSSRYYLPDGKLPKWVENVNKGIGSHKGETAQWKVDGQPTGLALVNAPAVDGKVSPFGISFPHTYVKGSTEALSTPLGLEYTVDVVEKSVEEFKLGRGKATDYLAVSFSSHDYVGHTFGPNSLEAEEMTVAEDKMLARLFNTLQKKIPGGMKNVLVVLTADHGIPPNPDWLRSEKMDAGRINEEKLQAALEEKLAGVFGKMGDKPWILKLKEFNLYLNPRAIAEKKIAAREVENALEKIILAEPWVASVMTAGDIRDGRVPSGLVGRQFQHSYYPGRSGDLIIVPKPFFMPGSDTVTHMTGYSYDRSVPLLFSGPHIKAGVFATSVEIIDIAPTLSFILGTVAPTMSEGRVIEEILR